MKVFINGQIYDSEETCIVLIFDNDSSRQAAAQHLINMAPKDGIRMYASYPAGQDPEKIEGIFDQIKRCQH